MDHVEANKNSRPLKLPGMIEQKYSIEEVTEYVTENGYEEINLTVIVSAISNENLDIASYLFEQLQSKLSKDNTKIKKKDLIPHVQECSDLKYFFDKLREIDKTLNPNLDLLLAILNPENPNLLRAAELIELMSEYRINFPKMNFSPFSPMVKKFHKVLLYLAEHHSEGAYSESITKNFILHFQHLIDKSQYYKLIKHTGFPGPLGYPFLEGQIDMKRYIEEGPGVNHYPSVLFLDFVRMIKNDVYPLNITNLINLLLNDEHINSQTITRYYDTFESLDSKRKIYEAFRFPFYSKSLEIGNTDLANRIIKYKAPALITDLIEWPNIRPKLVDILLQCIKLIEDKEVLGETLKTLQRFNPQELENLFDKLCEAKLFDTINFARYLKEEHVWLYFKKLCTRDQNIEKHLRFFDKINIFKSIINARTSQEEKKGLMKNLFQLIKEKPNTQKKHKVVNVFEDEEKFIGILPLIEKNDLEVLRDRNIAIPASLNVFQKVCELNVTLAEVLLELDQDACIKDLDVKAFVRSLKFNESILPLIAKLSVIYSGDKEVAPLIFECALLNGKPKLEQILSITDETLKESYGLEFFIQFLKDKKSLPVINKNYDAICRVIITKLVHTCEDAKLLIKKGMHQELIANYNPGSKEERNQLLMCLLEKNIKSNMPFKEVIKYKDYFKLSESETVMALIEKDQIELVFRLFRSGITNTVNQDMINSTICRNYRELTDYLIEYHHNHHNHWMSSIFCNDQPKPHIGSDQLRKAFENQHFELTMHLSKKYNIEIDESMIICAPTELKKVQGLSDAVMEFFGCNESLPLAP